MKVRISVTVGTNLPSVVNAVKEELAFMGWPSPVDQHYGRIYSVLEYDIDVAFHEGKADLNPGEHDT